MLGCAKATSSQNRVLGEIMELLCFRRSKSSAATLSDEMFYEFMLQFKSLLSFYVGGAQPGRMLMNVDHACLRSVRLRTMFWSFFLPVVSLTPLQLETCFSGHY